MNAPIAPQRATLSCLRVSAFMNTNAFAAIGVGNPPKKQESRLHGEVRGTGSVHRLKGAPASLASPMAMMTDAPVKPGTRSSIAAILERHAQMRLFFVQCRYFLAGAAATQAPFLSAPPFGSHFILAFTQSALVVGVACANAAGASRSVPINAVTGRSFIFLSLSSFCKRLVSIEQLAERPVNGAHFQRAGGRNSARN